MALVCRRTTTASWLAASLWLWLLSGTVRGQCTQIRPAHIARAAQPTLTAVASPDLNLRVAGSGWPTRSRLTITVRFWGAKASRILRSTSGGTLGFAVTNVRWCSRLTITVHDTRSNTVSLLGATPAASCAPVKPRMKIVIRSLSPAQMQFMQVVVNAVQPGSLYTLHVSDVVFLYRPGTGGPAILPVPDSEHLDSIDQGPLPQDAPPPGWPSPPGWYWRFRATHPGDATLTLSHTCRQSTPPCMLPDRLVRLQILAAGS